MNDDFNLNLILHLSEGVIKYLKQLFKISKKIFHDTMADAKFGHVCVSDLGDTNMDTPPRNFRKKTRGS